MEHLKRSPTDPLTREPLRAAELRPNIALRQACEEFLQENGWAADWWSSFVDIASRQSHTSNLSPHIHDLRRQGAS